MSKGSLAEFMWTSNGNCLLSKGKYCCPPMLYYDDTGGWDDKGYCGRSAKLCGYHNNRVVFVPGTTTNSAVVWKDNSRRLKDHPFFHLVGIPMKEF